MSMFIGLLFDHGHLSRAVCCRLAHGEPDIGSSLPPGFRINHPVLGRVTTYDPPRETQKTKELSMNWVLGDQQVELTDGTKGICISTYVTLVVLSVMYTVSEKKFPPVMVLSVMHIISLS